MAGTRASRRVFVPPQDEIGLEIEGENFTVITAASQATPVDLDELTVASVEGGAIEIPVSYAELQNATEFEVQHFEDTEDPDDPDDPEYNPNTDGIKTTKRVQRNSNLEQCSICGSHVADLAMHIVNVHTAPSPAKAKPQPKAKLPAPEMVKKRPGSPVQSPFGLKPRKRAYCKGKYQQIKPVLRYPCDACKHVSKTTDQLKKHMIITHNGHKHTTWMFCGDCEYATRVEEELVNHVKHHQLFR